ncbi:MAG: metal ABC transporter permease [Chloroflexota bacterium]|jgi:manganese/zinc/iron transport system permease protein
MILFDLFMTGVIVSLACALPGLWLMLRGMSMLSDALTHSVLLGIVVTYLFVGDVASPWMFVGAVVSGVITALFIERLQHRKVSADAAVGLVFAGMFSVAIILITQFAGDTHLDLDAVLLGEIVFAPFDRMVIAGVDLGPRALFMNALVFVLSALFMWVFWKELVFTTFDATSAVLVGFSPAILSTGLVVLSSLTVVTAFDAVGAILVVAFMTAAPASAFLLTYRLKTMVWLTMFLAITAALLGIWGAMWLDVSVSGAMATAAGVQFGMIWLFAPSRGLIAHAFERRTLRYEVQLLAHLMHHVSHKHDDHTSLAPSSIAYVSELHRRGWLENGQITMAGSARLTEVGGRNISEA